MENSWEGVNRKWWSDEVCKGALAQGGRVCGKEVLVFAGMRCKGKCKTEGAPPGSRVHQGHGTGTTGEGGIVPNLAPSHSIRKQNDTDP